MYYKIKKKLHETSRIRNLLSIHFIWAPLPFLLFTDVVLETYHRICFPLYNMKTIVRSDYISIIDREKLQYLN